MMRRVVALAVLTLLAACGHVLADDRKKRDKEAQKLEELKEDIRDASRKLRRRLAVPKPGEDNAFLHTQASALIDRAKEALADHYRCDRLVEAANELMEASESIFEAREPDKDRDDYDRQEAARRLERYYFRLQQADYFARQSGEKDAEAYVRHARGLYQRARSAYDAGEYRQARKLGEASADVVSALEKLAQASVRVPEPPRLK